MLPTSEWDPKEKGERGRREGGREGGTERVRVRSLDE